MISMTFEREGNWPFLLQIDVAGDGSTTANIKMNTSKWIHQNEYIKMNTSKWIPNGYGLKLTF
jgi:hypothetical protein